MTSQLAFKNQDDQWRYWNGESRPMQGQEGLFQLPVNAADAYHPNKLRTFGLYIVREPSTPTGQRMVERLADPVDQDGKPWAVYSYEVEPEPPAVPYTLYRSVLIDRMEADEATILEAALQSPDTPSKMRLLFNSVEYFVSDDPLFAILYWTIWQSLVPTLGDEAAEARADALLAPVAS